MIAGHTVFHEQSTMKRPSTASVEVCDGFDIPVGEDAPTIEIREEEEKNQSTARTGTENDVINRLTRIYSCKLQWIAPAGNEGLSNWKQYHKRRRKAIATTSVPHRQAPLPTQSIHTSEVGNKNGAVA